LREVRMYLHGFQGLYTFDAARPFQGSAEAS